MAETLRKSYLRWAVAAVVALVAAGLGGCGSTSTSTTTNGGNTTGSTTNGGSTAGNTAGSNTNGGSTAGNTTGTRSVTISMSAFSPTDLTVTAGDTVVWTNQDSVNHTITADATNAASGGPSSDTTFPAGLSTGQTFSFVVPAGTAAGTKWYYHCRFHGAAGNGSADGAGMSGSLTVQ